jgi:hypothetical protein
MRMKDYLMFLEEKGVAEFNDHNEEWVFHGDDIYSQDLLDEYNGQMRFSFMSQDTPATNEDSE